MPNNGAALARAVREYLTDNHLTVRAAAARAQLPTSTLAALTARRYGTVVSRETREGLVRMGMRRDVVEYAAALAAGFDVAPAELSADEWATVRHLRAFPAGHSALVHTCIASMARLRDELTATGTDTP